MSSRYSLARPAKMFSPNDFSFCPTLYHSPSVDWPLILQQIGFLSHWDPYTVISLEAVAYSSYCNTVEWFWWDWSLFQWPTGFLHCFDAVGWVIWSVKIVPEMTYKVSSETLSLHSLTHHGTTESRRLRHLWIWKHFFKYTVCRCSTGDRLVSEQEWCWLSDVLTISCVRCA